MMIAIEGVAGSGKSTLRDRTLTLATERDMAILHVGQFSWLSLTATRTLVSLRTRRAAVSEDAALTAVLADLSLHLKYNLAPAAQHGHLLVDRLILSSACLLAWTYDKPVDRYVERLTQLDQARPDLTVLLTTPVQLCTQRVAGRAAAGRISDAIDSATRLQSLYADAADAWQKVTGRQVLRLELSERHDTEKAAMHLVTTLSDWATR